jgi:hypothetical protein
VGVAALGVGTYFGLHAFASWSDSNRACPRGVCTEAGAADARDAKTSAIVSDVAFAAGVLAVGAGLYWVLTSHPAQVRSAGATAGLRVGLSGLAIDGTW